MESQCFGNKKGSSGSNVTAYILFYERLEKKDIRLVVPKTHVLNLKNANYKVEEADGENVVSLPFEIDLNKHEAISNVFFRSNSLLNEVLADNRKNASEDDILAKEVFIFIGKLIEGLGSSSCSIESKKEAITTVVDLFSSVIYKLPRTH